MGLASNDLANGFEIVIICPCAGSTGRMEEKCGVTKERAKKRWNTREGKKWQEEHGGRTQQYTNQQTSHF